MTYILGASFSNVQNSFSLPTYFVAVAVESARESMLKNIRTKEEFQEDIKYKKDFFDLSQVENEMNRFKDMTIRSEVIELSKKYRTKASSDLFFILDGFLRAIRSIRSSDLRVSAEEFESCVLHIPLSSEGEELVVEDMDFFGHPLSKYKPKFQRKAGFDEILELARLCVWYKNFDMIRRKKQFINKQIRENPSLEFFQIQKLIWNSPPIELYSNSFVGYPRLVMKAEHKMKDLLIFLGRHLDILPISPVCSGVEKGLNVPECSRESLKEPFGTILSNRKFEKCTSCAKKMMGSLCLFQKPRCDGKQISCGDKRFVSQVCHANFCIYLTICNSKLKVGRSIKSRIIGRLIEQSAFDGLVFYPIPWLPFADYLEEQLANMLKANTSGFKLKEINGVTERITSADRLKSITSLYKNSKVQKKREMIYRRIVEVLNSIDTPETAYLLSLERRKVNLWKNWVIPEELDLDDYSLVKDIQFKRIKGNVAGIIGSFVLVNEQAFNTASLGGYLASVPKK